MIPYSSLLFFYILLLLLIPAIILGLCGVNIKKYGILATLFFLFYIFGDSEIHAISLASFYLFELILIKTFLYLRVNKRVANRWLMRAFVLLAILPLIIVKFTQIYPTISLGFLGISYLTFKAVQMLLEVYDGLIKKVKIVDFTYFLLFFPTISSGPIDRSRRFTDDVNKKVSRKEYLAYLDTGFTKLVVGIGYKFILAYLITNYWLNKIPQDHSFFNTINYMYAYSLNLFFDFAGYSLIAIGVSYIFGVRTPDNFDKPFLSKDIKDFWNRWHMSLSFWFRDFIYTRFVMSSLKKKRFKSKFTASYWGFILTMFTMGLWHGTQIYYIVYGLYHGLLIVITDYFQRKSSFYKKYKNNMLFSSASIFVTFHLICFGFLIFSGYLFNNNNDFGGILTWMKKFLIF